MYQIKEVTDKFGITRDTIYHYEKHGLVSLKREENSYRVLDELNVQKIKKILDLRDLGLSIEDIKRYCACEQVNTRMEMMLEIQKRTEEEIRNLKRRLERIHAQQRNLSESARFVSGFNVDYNIALCIDCPYRTAEERKYFYVRDGFIIHVASNGNLLHMEKHEISIKHLKAGSFCGACGQEKPICRRVFRGRIIYENMEQFRDELQKIYQEGLALDYPLRQVFYATLQAPRINQKERLTVMLYIPMEEEN